MFSYTAKFNTGFYFLDTVGWLIISDKKKIYKHYAGSKMTEYLYAVLDADVA